jgi:hypothetical protein
MNKLKLAKELVRLTNLIARSNWMSDLIDYYGKKANPDSKDYKRVVDIWYKASDKYPDDEAEARRQELRLTERMAKAIRHPDKAYRRARAAESYNYHSMAEIFFKRAEELWNSRRQAGTLDRALRQKIDPKALREIEDIVWKTEGNIDSSRAKRALANIADKYNVNPIVVQAHYWNIHQENLEELEYL